jgi:N6-L-threonylcarbamoyladenine synthase
MTAPAERFVLGIETSCDETAASVVAGVPGATRVLSNIIASQDDLHAEYRGVVPEIASRAHAERLLPIVRRALADAGVRLDQLHAVGVGHRPGLIGCLLVGVAGAKALAWSLGIPFIGVDHVRAHMYAGCLDAPAPSFPAVGLVVSGGHTSIYRVDSWSRIARLGGTIDDAVGEAFDKGATVLGLPFPGGPNLDRLAETAGANDRAVEFPVSRLAGDGRELSFSFSGLKTALLYAAKGVPGPRGAPAVPLTDARRADLAASFRRAAVDAVMGKLRLAIDAIPERGPGLRRTVLTGGGVTRNSLLRRRLQAWGEGARLDVRVPALEYCVDNAAMIAGLALELLAERGWTSDPLSLSADPVAS